MKIFSLGLGSQCEMFFKIVKYIGILSRRSPLFLEIITQKTIPQIFANTLSESDALRHPKKSFQIPIPLPIPSKVI